MGMFDSFYDADGHEWQTKAFDCELDVWRIGDSFTADCGLSFQVYVLGSTGSTLNGTYETFESLATIRDGVVAAVPDERDESLFLLDYSGGPAVRPLRPIVTAHPESETSA